MGDAKPAAVRVLRGVAAPGLADLATSLLIDDAGQVRVEAAERLRALEAGDAAAEDGDATRAVVAELDAKARIALHRSDFLLVGAAQDSGVLDRQHGDRPIRGHERHDKVGD